MAPAAAVVVATHNRADRLPRLVAGLEEQRDIDHVEVVIVDDGSSDETWSVLTDLASRSRLEIRPVRLIRNCGPATARNVGWRATTAQVVAFTDDDCVPTARWLASLREALGQHDIAQGRTVPDPAQRQQLGPFSRTLDIAYEDGYYQTCNIAYRRDVLERLGGFYEEFRFPAAEDTDLAWRARESGARTTFVDTAVVHHDVRPSDFRLAIRDSWRWQSAALVVRRHPELRSAFPSRYVWRASHQYALSALAGLAVAARSPRARGAWLAGLALAAPYVRYRTVTAPLPGAGRRRRWLLLPGALTVDTAEIAACLVGSVKHRTLVI